MNDDQFERVLGQLRESYNRPPDTPKEEMWSAIEVGLAEEDAGAVISLNRARDRQQRRRAATIRWTGWSVAAAALILMGIGIGRVSTASGPSQVATADDGTSVRPAPEQPSPERPTRPAGNQAAFRFAAVSHLLKSESLLTMVRNDADAGRYDVAVGGWAAKLLTETRLLMDSPAATDPAIGELLQDLELILAQMARLSSDDAVGARGREEMDLIARGMDRQEMLLRIQAVLPAGSGRVGA